MDELKIPTNGAGQKASYDFKETFIPGKLPGRPLRFEFVRSNPVLRHGLGPGQGQAGSGVALEAPGCALPGGAGYFAGLR